MEFPEERRVRNRKRGKWWMLIKFGAFHVGEAEKNVLKRLAMNGKRRKWVHFKRSFLRWIDLTNFSFLFGNFQSMLASCGSQSHYVWLVQDHRRQQRSSSDQICWWVPQAINLLLLPTAPSTFPSHGMPRMLVSLKINFEPSFPKENFKVVFSFFFINSFICGMRPNTSFKRLRLLVQPVRYCFWSFKVYSRSLTLWECVWKTSVSFYLSSHTCLLSEMD